MNNDELVTRRAAIEEQFNQKKAAREEHISQAALLLEEMNQLKGSYQTLSELIEQPKATMDLEVKEKKKK